MNSILADTASRIYKTFHNDADAQWAALCDSGLPQTMMPAVVNTSSAEKQHGESAITASDMFGLMRVCGQHGSPVPLADTLLIRWMLLPVAELADDCSFYLCDEVFAGNADSAGGTVRWMDASESSDPPLPAGTGALELRYATTPSSTAHMPLSSWMTSTIFQALGATMRCCQMVGAMEAALNLTLDFARQRVQFGRPLSRFQAVQFQLADAVAELAAATAATDFAVASLENGVVPAATPLAMAKVRCNSAADSITAHTHQLHGALGYTQEYELAVHTQNLMSWREQFGNEFYWSNYLGNQWLADDTANYPFYTHGD